MPKSRILPIIEVSPPVLATGEYIDQPIVRNLTISNVGEATLDISSIMIQGDEASRLPINRDSLNCLLNRLKMLHCPSYLSPQRFKMTQPFRLEATTSILPSLKFR